MDTQVHLELQLAGVETEHNLESHSELQVLAWKHERQGEHCGWCLEDRVYRNEFQPWLEFQMDPRTSQKAFWMAGSCGRTLH